MKRMITLAGALLAVLGFYGPWVTTPRQAAALTYNALDLTEFCKFIVRAQLGQVTRELFLVPIVAAALALALWASRPSQRFRVLRYALCAVAVVLSLVPLPPYPHVLTAYASAEDRGSFWLSLAGLLGVALIILFGRRITSRWRDAALVALALIGAALPVWELVARALPAVSRAYASPAVVGWGLVITVAGFFLVAAGALIRGNG
jgi:hypothetical protein